MVCGGDAGDSGWVTEWPGEEHGALGGSTLRVWCGARLGVAWLRVPRRVPGRSLGIEQVHLVGRMDSPNGEFTRV